MLNLIKVSYFVLNSTMYHTFHNGVNGGLELGTLAIGGAGLVKGVYSLTQKGFSATKGLMSMQKIARPAAVFRSSTLSKLDRPATSSMSAHLLKNRLIAQEISGGHAFEKHVITRNEFPGFSRIDFEKHLKSVLNHPTEMKSLTNGRTAYWDQNSGTVIIRDPPRIDGGTAFRPLHGKKYYDDVLK